MTTAGRQSFRPGRQHEIRYMAREHGEADFQSRFDKSTAQAQEMKEGALRVL
jgi:hypothetical protein